jgi:hypothetical protein
MKKIGKGGSHFGGLRSPMAAPSHGLIKGGSLMPRVAANTLRPEIKTSSAKIRSAQTGGAVIKPW